MSPLDGRPGTGVETAVMVEHPHAGKINLRGDPADQAFLDAVKNAAGATPPTDANTVAAAGRNKILWLGPDSAGRSPASMSLWSTPPTPVPRSACTGRMPATC